LKFSAQVGGWSLPVGPTKAVLVHPLFLFFVVCDRSMFYLSGQTLSLFAFSLWHSMSVIGKQKVKSWSVENFNTSK
jgi:hypothetical protein